MTSDESSEGLQQYQMPPFTGRNIVIFSDGTGQAGGILVDEYRTNVYKLYRATRCGPDTDIDPDRQLAFYDPGLGSSLAGEDIKVGFLRRIYNVLSSATGLGITKNIIDCYAALLQLWRPGDRIFLFGFSRGAYTVRCLGGVLGLCGIPTSLPGTVPLRRDPETLRTIAREAVMRVYQHGSGADNAGQAAAGQDLAVIDRKHRLSGQRQALGAQFRDKYKSADPRDPSLSNAIPHFIGVWDTVAAVGLAPPSMRVLKLSCLGIALGLSFLVAWALATYLGVAFLGAAVTTFVVIALMGIGTYFLVRLKFVTNLPGYRWFETVHLTSFKMAFFDRSLNPHVRYARHAIAIDERRADFDRVPWVNDAEPPKRERAEGAWFKQIWFAGNHSDIGGSYPENESRLSDIALGWMAEEAQKAGLLVDPKFLRLYGRHTGRQHDECRVGIRVLGRTVKWREKPRRIASDAPLHPSVLRRLEEQNVLVYDVEQPYRPEILASHKECEAFFGKADVS